jgi:hypothetical protein
LKGKYTNCIDKLNDFEIEQQNSSTMIKELEKRNKILLGENTELQKRRKQARVEINKLEGKLNRSFSSAREVTTEDEEKKNGSNIRNYSEAVI